MAEKSSRKRREASSLSKEQQKEGYRVERSGGYVLVWHDNNQIALLLNSADIKRKVQDVVARREKDLEEVFAKTGWRPPQRQL